MNIFKALRPLNLLILFISQLLTSYFLGFGNLLQDVFDKSHLSIYLTTQLCAIFGYLFNDIMDIKADAVNRPSANYLADLPTRNKGLIIAIISAGFAILSGFLMSYKLGVLITLVISLLFFYSVSLKRLPIIGNLIIAALGAFSVFILLAFDTNLNQELVIIFSINAFGIHFIREILKDTQDMDGDRAAGYKTFPVLTGIKATRSLILILLFLYILVFTTCIRLMMVRYFSAPLNYIFLAYNILCIGLPLFHLLSQLQLATEKSDFLYLSRVSLYIMITGTLSMLFF
ncbi:MAG: UbiA family prenyltransferase [Bacteroidia bacterium]